MNRAIARNTDEWIEVSVSENFNTGSRPVISDA